MAIGAKCSSGFGKFNPQNGSFNNSTVNSITNDSKQYEKLFSDMAELVKERKANEITDEELTNMLNDLYTDLSLDGIDLNAPITANNAIPVTQELLKQLVANNPSNANEREAAKLIQQVKNLIDTTQRNKDLSWLTRTISKLSEYVVDKHAPLITWYSAMFGNNKERATDNDMAVALSNVKGKFQGEIELFSQQVLKPLLELVRPFAKATGLNEFDMARVFGQYTEALHMVTERNDFIRGNLTADADTIRQNAEALDNEINNTLQQELDNKIQELSDAKNDLNNNRNTPNFDIMAQLKKIDTIGKEVRKIKDTIAVKQKELDKATKDLAQAEGRLNRLVDNLDNEDPDSNVISGGLTNAQATNIIENLEEQYKEHITKDDFEKMAKVIANMDAWLRKREHDNGFITQEQVQNLPDFLYHVHVARTSDATEFENFVYDPTKIHEIEGNNFDSLMNPFDAALRQAVKNAKFVSTQDVARLMASMYTAGKAKRMQAKEDDVDPKDMPRNIIQMYNYDKIIAKGNKRTAKEQEVLEQGVMYVATMPDGTTKRVIFRFNPNYQFQQLGLTGATMNRAFSNTIDEMSYIKGLAKATGMLGSMMTHYNIGFGPSSFIYSSMENTSHLFSRELSDTDGRRFSGPKMVGKYLYNTIKAVPDVVRGLKGDGDVYFNEFMRHGLIQNFSYFGTDDTLGAIRKSDLDSVGIKDRSMVQKITDKLGQYGAPVGRFFTWYNSVLNGAPMYSVYKTLRQQGMSETGAAHNTRTLIDMGQRGKYTNFMRMFAPFVVPAMQGGANTFRDLGFTVNGTGDVRLNKKGLATFIMSGAISGALYNFARELMGKDDEGKYYMDQIPFSVVSRNLCIPINGGQDYIKIGLGFGNTVISSAMTIGLQRVIEGNMEPSDYAFHVLATIVKNASPANIPEFDFTEKPLEWVIQALTPDLLQPLAQVAMNTDHFGRPIHNTYTSEYDPKSSQGRPTTAKAYHAIADTLHKAGIEFAPEDIRAIIDGYSQGPFRLFTSLLDHTGRLNSSDYTSARETLGPILTALGALKYYGRNYNQDQQIFNKELNKYKQRLRDENIEFTRQGLQGNDLLAWRASKLSDAGWDDADINTFISLLRSESEINKLRLEFKKYMKRAMYDDTITTEELQELFDQFGQRQSDVIRQFRMSNGI